MLKNPGFQDSAQMGLELDPDNPDRSLDRAIMPDQDLKSPAEKRQLNLDIPEPEPAETEPGAVTAQNEMLFEEFRRGDFVNTKSATQLTPEIANLLGQGQGLAIGLETDGAGADPEINQIRDSLKQVEIKKILNERKPGIAAEYNNKTILELGIVTLKDPEVARGLVQFRGLIKADQLQGGSDQALEILFSHPLLSVRNLNPGTLSIRALADLAERPYYTPVHNIILSDQITAYRDLRNRGVSREEIIANLDADISENPQRLAQLEQMLIAYRNKSSKKS